MNNQYPNTNLFIDGAWRIPDSGDSLEVLNPATEEVIGQVAKAGQADMDATLIAAQKGFETWSKTPALNRSRLMRKAADLIRERAHEIARIMVLEQGKPFFEASIETLLAADIFEWYAEEGRRAYGRVIPARSANVRQLSLREPVGVVAAFTPWNFPINQAVRKIAGAMAAGCSIIVKGPEETPASLAAIFTALNDAGVTSGVVNLLFGVPAEISSYLIAHPIVRKISFTGSTQVGKHLASLAGSHMKRITMELGGHAPALVFADADIQSAVSILAQNKFRNAGQVCVSPTRFLVQSDVYDTFLDQFVSATQQITVGNGLDPATKMGPLANDRRVSTMQQLILDSQEHGGKVAAGGDRIGQRGYFFTPTVVTDVPKHARVMNEEPFGPIAVVSRFDGIDEAIREANRLPYGLAAYAYTSSDRTAARLSSEIETGMLSINHHGLALPETPFGGVKDSGYGSEGGVEGLEAYLSTKFVTHAA
ncbi:NAD-dependent succinate-semialdehyde dehydrogenase [Caballeronia sp. LP003]|uniref:NAD-dependent succinate-semialdehyde dehydrogenase n=1 Tax=Caballeronia sp. LP003 TaxID=3038551 RepID=UPI002865711E|nr:NAD-dependent succinate-semialdehyde dehydrogenase [Caballeronia sp. LP003]MDR5785265.1 NAD-dependent succinate-semialdehyde dehydrogenase [Caballeronia sp. LP003]